MIPRQVVPRQAVSRQVVPRQVVPRQAAPRLLVPRQAAMHSLGLHRQLSAISPAQSLHLSCAHPGERDTSSHREASLRYGPKV